MYVFFILFLIFILVSFSSNIYINLYYIYILFILFKNIFFNNNTVFIWGSLKMQFSSALC